MSRTAPVIFLAMLCFPFVSHSATPSFDCGLASAAREHLICSSEELATLDNAMDSAFKAKRGLLTDLDRSGLVAQQKNWLHQLSVDCPLSEGPLQNTEAETEKSCFVEKYKRRVAELKAPLSAGGVRVIFNEADIKRFTQNLEKTLSEISPHSKIVLCDMVVRSEEESGQDEIYGASCTASIGTPKPLRLLMCDDTMIGKFTLTTSYFWGTPPLETIGTFVRNNCPAGG